VFYCPKQEYGTYRDLCNSTEQKSCGSMFLLGRYLPYITEMFFPARGMECKAQENRLTVYEYLNFV
jgi:hypothetical protein